MNDLSRVINTSPPVLPNLPVSYTVREFLCVRRNRRAFELCLGQDSAPREVVCLVTFRRRVGVRVLLTKCQGVVHSHPDIEL